MQDLTPKQIVEELDKYIVGQTNAKKAVAIALRNRFRRKKLPQELRDDIVPKNIIMIGPTGVGKTEIARRIAKMSSAPFVKVEATKFTEVGYVGKDVESMIRDLVETSIRLVRRECMIRVEEKAKGMVDQRLLEVLVPFPGQDTIVRNPFEVIFSPQEVEEVKDNDDDALNTINIERNKLKEKLINGELEDQFVEIEVEDSNPPMIEVFSGSTEDINMNIQDMLGGILPKRKRHRKMTVGEARNVLLNQEAQKLIDEEEVTKKAVERAEQTGIIFLDEIDKIAAKESSGGPDVSRGGVQRDILPIVEGSTIMTKYGPLKTDYILFIAAGAFHISKPSDLIPELQGRFPIRVELEGLTEADFRQILIEPQNALIKQYIALLNTEGIEIKFSENALAEIAKIAYTVNEQTENIGARRLHTILEKLLEDISFNAPDMEIKFIEIDSQYVSNKLNNVVRNQDLSRYIL